MRYEDLCLFLSHFLKVSISLKTHIFQTLWSMSGFLCLLIVNEREQDIREQVIKRVERKEIISKKALLIEQK